MSENITKQNIANHLHTKIGFSKLDNKILVNDFFTSLKEILIENNKIDLDDFGTFTITHKKARMGRNPKTKIDILIKERDSILFQASRNMKIRINNE